MKERAFSFWQKWLTWANVMALMAGLIVAFAGNSFVFSLYNAYTEEVFFEGIGMEGRPLAFKNWLFGIIGGTIVGFHSLMVMISENAFKKKEKWDVITSTVLWSAMIGLLAFGTYEYGFMWLIKYYAGPYIVFVIWLDLVTFLHHTEPDIPWYRDGEWTFLKGALSSVDRDYGFISHIHHDIGTHVAHHIFLNIPHYNLKKATEAIKPLLGEYYHKTEEPIYISLWNSYKKCHFVPNEGKVVYYTSHNQ